MRKIGEFAWLESNVYRIAGPLREVYLHFDPDHGAANYDSPRHITAVSSRWRRR